MGCNTYLKLCSVIVIFLLHRVNSVTSDGCSDQSPRWRDLGGNNCFIIEENNTLTWIDAVYQCFSEGGSLASFHSADDAHRVTSNIQDRTARLYIGLWKHSDGTFEWVDKSAVDFTNWYPGEPNLYFERCAEIYADNGKWNDAVCSETFGYVCSSPKKKTSPGSDILSLHKACPGTAAGWQDLGGEFCYIIEEENKLTSDDALDRCIEAGGSLASFHSFEEISAVVQHIKAYKGGFHIGLRLNVDGEYKWMDGSALDMVFFYVWHSSRDNRQCFYMISQSGQWFGTPCQHLLGYICSAPKVVTCEEHFVDDRGVIHSPNYPNKYGPNEKCVSYITVPQDSRVILEFLDFQVDNIFNCEKDFVEILDGHEAESPVLGKFCGYGIPNSIRSSGNKMTVIFSSDDSIEEYGFYARFEKDSCGGVAATDRGVITSPHYPQSYRGLENCTWQITAPENHQIFLQFETFELEGGYDCRYDSAVIRDGLEPSDPVLGTFCGGIVPDIIRSSANVMSITFTSDGSDQRKGFKAVFQTKDISTLVAVETVLEELFPVFLEDKIQGAKEHVVYKIVGTSEDEEHSQTGREKPIEVVLQQL